MSKDYRDVKLPEGSLLKDGKRRILTTEASLVKLWNNDYDDQWNKC